MSRSLAHVSNLATAGKVGWRLPRHVLNIVENYRVTRHDVDHDLDLLVRVCNLARGPLVVFDCDRLCFGLRADRDYNGHEVVTEYGGQVSHDFQAQGDYVAQLGNTEVTIDGYCGFLVREKGRWINESDNLRTLVNVELGRRVRTIKHVKRGDWLFADYGHNYKRCY